MFIDSLWYCKGKHKIDAHASAMQHHNQFIFRLENDADLGVFSLKQSVSYYVNKSTPIFAVTEPITIYS